MSLQKQKRVRRRKDGGGNTFFTVAILVSTRNKGSRGPYKAKHEKDGDGNRVSQENKKISKISFVCGIRK